jgi:hypothetical protein
MRIQWTVQLFRLIRIFFQTRMTQVVVGGDADPRRHRRRAHRASRAQSFDFEGELRTTRFANFQKNWEPACRGNSVFRNQFSANSER